MLVCGVACLRCTVVFDRVLLCGVSLRSVSCVVLLGLCWCLYVGVCVCLVSVYVVLWCVVLWCGCCVCCGLM